MDEFEITAGIAVAIVMIVASAYFIWQQFATLQMLGASPKIPIDQRRYLYKQCWRRIFGSFVLALLAAMIVGSLFLNYEPLQKPIDELPQAEQEIAKQTFRFISMYWIALLMLVMLTLALAVFDLWATARHGMQQQKQLFLEHQEILAAELEELRHRQSEMN